jgi:hypothetical protein
MRMLRRIVGRIRELESRLTANQLRPHGLVGSSPTFSAGPRVPDNPLRVKAVPPVISSLSGRGDVVEWLHSRLQTCVREFEPRRRLYTLGRFPSENLGALGRAYGVVAVRGRHVQGFLEDMRMESGLS